jgi:serine/threonine protein kinase
VLLSVRDSAWKITDFGLTSEGTSRIAYTTTYARGTECYRAPELVRGLVVNMRSDIWALGCILYEITFTEKAFRRDFDLFNYAHKKERLEFPQFPTPLSDKMTIYISELIYGMLELNWWNRPSSRDLLHALTDVFSETIPVWITLRPDIDINLTKLVKKWPVQEVQSSNEVWKHILWRRFWYWLSVSVAQRTSKTCQMVPEIQIDATQTRHDRVRALSYNCACSREDDKSINWEFVLDGDYFWLLNDKFLNGKSFLKNVLLRCSS